MTTSKIVYLPFLSKTTGYPFYLQVFYLLFIVSEVRRHSYLWPTEARLGADSELVVSFTQRVA